MGRGDDYVDGLSKGEGFVLPDIPAGAYPNSFEGRLCGIVGDTAISDDRYTDTLKLDQRLTMASRDRRFIGFPRPPRDN